MMNSEGKHRHPTDKIVRKALHQIVELGTRPYAQVKKDFIKNDEETTINFWEFIREAYDNKFNRVEHCPYCGRFTLYHEQEQE